MRAYFNSIAPKRRTNRYRYFNPGPNKLFSMMNFSGICPCGSGVSYDRCCGPYHDGVALMRSRYSAYCLQDSRYLLATWEPRLRPKSLDFTGDRTEWLKLDILDVHQGGIADQRGTVTFHAHFRLDGQQGVMTETSRFVKSDGRWFYRDGKVGAAPAGLAPNRNAPCPCGSGKKFKRCCGHASSQ